MVRSAYVSWNVFSCWCSLISPCLSACCNQHIVWRSVLGWLVSRSTTLRPAFEHSQMSASYLHLFTAYICSLKAGTVQQPTSIFYYMQLVTILSSLPDFKQWLKTFVFRYLLHCDILLLTFHWGQTPAFSVFLLTVIWHYSRWLLVTC